MTCMLGTLIASLATLPAIGYELLEVRGRATRRNALRAAG
jgi:hypothetical protein